MAAPEIAHDRFRLRRIDGLEHAEVRLEADLPLCVTGGLRQVRDLRVRPVRRIDGEVDDAIEPLIDAAIAEGAAKRLRGVARSLR
ncbi:MAG: hypothetical protein ACKVT1_13460 [Dehalococcoidia bacterium]